MASLLRRVSQWVVELAIELAFALMACAGLAALVGAARWGGSVTGCRTAPDAPGRVGRRGVRKRRKTARFQCGSPNA